MSLHAKILTIMKSIHAIQRDKEIAGSKSSYRVTTEEAVLSKLRPLMVDLGLIMFPTKMSISHTGQTAIVEGSYKLVDTETGEFEVISSVGAGYDPSDKHAGKAMTYCGKYALLKLFMISTTNDDPDNFSSEDNINQEVMRRQKELADAAATVKTQSDLMGFIQSKISSGRIQPDVGARLLNKASTTPPNEVAAAASYVASL